MNFLDPKIDFVFKKLFGTITNKDTFLNQAFDVLAESNWSREERETYDRIIHAERCRQSEIKTAIEDALLEGKEKGKEEGIKEGEIKSKMNIAKEMLKEKFNIELISKVTGLTIEEIKNLS